MGKHRNQLFRHCTLLASCLLKKLSMEIAVAANMQVSRLRFVLVLIFLDAVVIDLISRQCACLDRCRSAINGPHNRIPPSPMSAIDRALISAQNFAGRNVVFLPSEGTMFDSLEEGYQFYNLNSWDIGFGIRFGRSRTNSLGYRSRQDIVCACTVSPNVY